MSVHRQILLFGSATVIVAAFAAIGCKDKNEAAPAAAASTTRSYNATASAGDFITVVIHSDTRTIDYSNTTNGDSGTVSYTIAGDGSYSITDPTGNLMKAYEIPGFALVMAAEKTGPNSDTPSIITAVVKEQMTKESMKNKTLNYMQFRTHDGGMEIGQAVINANADVQPASYWPMGAAFPFGGHDGFITDMPPFLGTSLQEDASGYFIKIPETDQQGNPVGYSYIFQTASGFFAVDMPNGSMVCMPEAATKDFQTASAGSYQAMVYMRNNNRYEETSPGNWEEVADAPTLGKGTITVTAAAKVTVVAENGQTIVNQADLTPVADDSTIVTGLGGKTCKGMFKFQVPSNGTTSQDVFVVFMTNAMLFCSFEVADEAQRSYNYFYGVGLKSAQQAPPVARN